MQWIFGHIACHYQGTSWSTHRFYAVDVDGPAVLGWNALDKLEVISVNAINKPEESKPVTSVQDLKSQFPNQFDCIGNFQGKTMLHLKKDARPYTDAPRKCSIHVKPKLKGELDKMEGLDIIRKMDYRTDWCSSLTTTVKPDGSLRVCLDPKILK